MDDVQAREHEIISLELQWREALQHGDRDAAAAFMTNEFAFTADRVSDVSLQRDDWIDGVAVRHLRGTFEHTDFNVRVSGDVAIVESICRQCDPVGPGDPPADAYRDTDVWRRIGGRWLVTSRHEAHLPD